MLLTLKVGIALIKVVTGAQRWHRQNATEVGIPLYAGAVLLFHDTGHSQWTLSHRIV